MRTKLTLASALLALAMVLPARAQQYQLLSLMTTNNVAAATANTATSAAIGLTKLNDVAVMLKFNVMASGNSNVVFTFSRSLAGNTNWGTASTIPITVAGNGTTPVVLITNLTLGAVGYLRLEGISNANTAAITNITVRYATKPKRDG